jgi:hypothetical protein
MSDDDKPKYEDLAPSRSEIHKNHKSHRPLSKGFEEVAMSGEFKFGEFSGFWPDTILRPGGDGGIDFRIPLMFTIDVKTFRNPKNLVHEVGKPFADIYVLARYSDEKKESTLLGWEWGIILKKAPKKTLHGHSVLNHYIPAEELKPIKLLAKRFLIKPFS